jgi:hypothetical protein
MTLGIHNPSPTFAFRELMGLCSLSWKNYLFESPYFIKENYVKSFLIDILSFYILAFIFSELIMVDRQT